MLFLCYPKCSTCQKARKWLDEHGIKYTERHIAEKNPTYDELKVWYQQSGLPIKKFFNTSGLVYKEMQLKDKLTSMSEEEQLMLLARNKFFKPLMSHIIFTHCNRSNSSLLIDCNPLFVVITE